MQNRLQNHAIATVAAAISMAQLIACTDAVAPNDATNFAVERNLGVVSGAVADATTQGDLVEGAFAEITATQVNGIASTKIGSRGSFTLNGLYPGRWQLAISALHGWTAVFPGLHLYSDTTVTVDVTAGETTVLPALLLRPRPLLLLVGVHTCPFPLPDPPSVDDWNNSECEGGFWGGAQVDIDVNGVEGTATAGEHFRTVMGQGASVPSASWDSNYWSTAFNLAIPGDYDVTVVSVAPSAFTNPRASLRLVPWEKSITRVTVTRVFGYLGLDFWTP